MKIIIAGAGEMGTHLARMLAKERHDIALLDENDERLRALSNEEILPITGNPVSFHDLKEAGAGSADLFVSVTPEESVNVTACMLAARLGVRKTFARINNYEYMLPGNREFFEGLGISAMIYPEMLVAQEITTAISRPWTRQYFELLGGALVMIGVKIRENSSLINLRLAELPPETKLYHIVAIKRMDTTFIPNGNSTVMSGDTVFFTTTKDCVEDVRRQAGKDNPEVKKIFILGGTRIAIRTCQLLPQSIRVKLIEKDREKCHRIADMAPDNVLVIHGDGRDHDLLRQEGIEDAQAFVGLTDSESTNIMSCLTAKRFGGVVKTIAEVENLDYIPLAENMDIGSVVNKKLLAAGYIYRFLLGSDVANVKIFSFANANVAELTARAGSKVTRKPVRDLRLPSDMTLGGLMRNKTPVLIKGDTQIQADDRVIVFCLDAALRRLDEYFG
ncbi:MAG: Trk system potassium transporter TrkA [Tannerellaceae bacterium]|jgi:trk system potassium uptake protein TrkA|nr:Trk system potassium transporter TrkA [Tannerellaceae bacterium]